MSLETEQSLEKSNKILIKSVFLVTLIASTLIINIIISYRTKKEELSLYLEQDKSFIKENIIQSTYYTKLHLQAIESDILRLKNVSKSNFESSIFSAFNEALLNSPNKDFFVKYIFTDNNLNEHQILSTLKTNIIPISHYKLVKQKLIDTSYYAIDNILYVVHLFDNVHSSKINITTLSLGYDIIAASKNMELKNKLSSIDLKATYNDSLQDNSTVPNNSTVPKDKIEILNTKKLKKFQNIINPQIILYDSVNIGNITFNYKLKFDTKKIQATLTKELSRQFIEISIIAIFYAMTIFFYYAPMSLYKSFLKKKIKELLKIQKNHSNFLAFVVNEIKIPLNFILTGSEIMKEKLVGNLSEIYLRYAKGIYKNSKTILNLINDILDDNQIISGKFQILHSVNKIENIIQEAINLNLIRFDKKDFKLYFDTQTLDPLPLVICDQYRLKQVFIHIISNTIRYSHQNSVIRIKIAMQKKNLLIKIEENNDFLKKISEDKDFLLKYKKTLQSTTDSSESYTISIEIVKIILEAHNIKFTHKTEDFLQNSTEILIPQKNLVF